ncbi:MAG: AraC family transcriptional regulator [Christensenellaceae bacterium]|nr:AraC family transcriptional regulator [Christensenellaceae bacterium]
MELYYSTKTKLDIFNIEYYAYNIGSYHYNWHNQVELLIVLKGNLELTSGGKSYAMYEDDIIIINPGEGHTTFAISKECVAFVVHFDLDLFKAICKLKNNIYLNFVPSDDNRYSAEAIAIRQCAANLMELIAVDDKNKDLQVVLNLLSAISPLFNLETFVLENNFKAFRGKTENPIKKMSKYIDKNYMNNISLEELGRIGGYNTNYVSQLFKKHSGVSFYEYLTRIRLREAIIDLRETNLSIADVAYKNGFADVKSFNYYFKSHFSKSPSSYKNSLSAEHKEIDRVFKRTYLDSNSKLIKQKILEYNKDINKDSINSQYYCNNIKQKLNALQAFADNIKNELINLENL